MQHQYLHVHQIIREHSSNHHSSAHNAIAQINLVINVIKEGIMLNLNAMIRQLNKPTFLMRSFQL